MIKVLFDLKKEYYFNSLYPVYKELKADSNYDIYFNLGKDHKRFLGVFLIDQAKKTKNNLSKYNLKFTDDVSGFDLVICGDALKNPERYGETTRVHLDHGVGIKTLRIRNIVKQKGFHYHVFLEGNYWANYIKSLGWETKATLYTDTGIPKLDPFFWDGFYNKSEIIKTSGLDPKKKTVLFAPSYKPSCIKYVQERIADLLPEYNLIIKLHPYSWQGKYAPHSQHKFYEKLAKKHQDVILIDKDDFDIYPYLIVADTMISDTSSVINEFLALGKHGIIYVLPHDKLNHSDGMPVLSIDPKKWLVGAFPQMHKPENLISAVESALSPTNEMKSKLEEYKSYFFNGLDGNSGKRVKIEIDKLMEKYV